MNGTRKIKNRLTEWIVANQANLYRLAYSYVKNENDALDVVQDSLYKAFKSLKQIHEEENIRPWIYRIVINTSLDLLRKRKRSTPTDSEKIEGLQQGWLDNYANIDLFSCLDRLPVNYRHVIVLRYLEDLKISEVAETVEENVNTVKTRIYKALGMLRTMLAQEEDNHEKNN
ncbi:MAG: sigma-70 family RNA polymerase sigma factor [Sporolactobacillus sp.]